MIVCSSIIKRKPVYVFIMLCMLLLPNFSFSTPGSFSTLGPKTKIGSEPNPSDVVLELSKKKWTWIANRQMDSLDMLLDEKIISQQPNIRLDKAGYLDVIKNGNVRYEQISVLDTDIQIVDNLSTLLSRVEFRFPNRKKKPETKYVTEVYRKIGNDWKLILFQTNPT